MIARYGGYDTVAPGLSSDEAYMTVRWMRL
jgi:hypothetical protein